MSSDENALTNSNFVGRFRTSVFGTKKSTQGLKFETDTLPDFEEVLGKLSKRQVTHKEENFLFCPAVFDSELSAETSRGKANFVTATGVWLDFDGGHLRPKDLAALFPRIRMTAYATYSSTKENQRFRVYIPTSHHLTYELYVAFTSHIRAVLAENGYPLDKRIPGDNRKAHGLDKSKLTPISLFYAPCCPKDPSGTFFKTYKDKARSPLDVENWTGKVEILEDPYEFEAPTPTLSMDSVTNDKRNGSALTAWAIQATIPGVGHSEFWRLACRLATAGCDEHGVHSLLTQQAGLARHPQERLKEIPEILRQLRKKGWFRAPLGKITAIANDLGNNAIRATEECQPPSNHLDEGLLRFFS